MRQNNDRLEGDDEAWDQQRIKGNLQKRNDPLPPLAIVAGISLVSNDLNAVVVKAVRKCEMKIYYLSLKLAPRMKSLRLYFILSLTSFCSFAQTLDHDYTPHLFLGAPKELLIDEVVANAKTLYLNDVGAVIKKQKKMGVNLKKKKVLDAFFVAMANDMTRQLRGTNDWSYNSVNFTRWIYPIEELVGLEFNLPGFSVAKRDKNEREMVTVHFRDNQVFRIHTSVTITSPSSYNVYFYDNQTLDIIHNIILSKYSRNATHTTKRYENFLGERAFPAAELSYTFNDPKINYSLGFSFLPYGLQDKAGNWTYRGTSWQRVFISASLK